MDNYYRSGDDIEFENALVEVLAEPDSSGAKSGKNTKEKKVRALGGYLSLLLNLGFLGLSCVIKVLNFGEDLEVVFLENIFITGGMMLIVGFLSWIYSICFSFEEYSLEGFLRLFLFLMLLIFVDSHYLYSIVAAGILATDFKWLYEVVVLAVTAIVYVHLSKAIEKNNTFKRNLSVLMLFICWNIVIFYLSSQLYISYQSSIIVTNTLIAGVIILTTNTDKKMYGNKIAMIVIYLGVMFLSLYLKKEGNISINDYFFGGPGYYDYADAVKRLISKAQMFGPAYEGVSSSLTEMLKYNYNSLLSIVAYFGIIPAAIYYGLLVVMMGMFGKTLWQIKEDRVFFAIALSGYSHLLMRMVLGLGFALGATPFQIELPFTGYNRIIDFCAYAVLMMNYFRSKIIAGYKGPFCELRNILFRKLVEIYVLDEDTEWEEIEENEESY